MPSGILKTSFNERGFAFIDGSEHGDGGQDIFLHIRGLANGEESDRYVRGVRVEFDLELVDIGGHEKPQARNVRLVEGAVEADRAPELAKVDLRGRLKFWHANGYGFLKDEDSGDDFYVSSTSVPGRYLRNGDIVEFDVEKQEHDRSQAVNIRVVGWNPTDDPFDDQLDMGNPRWVEQLAAEAEKEPWNYPENPAQDSFAILRSYIKYTFLRLNDLESHVPVTGDGTYLSFNTGLVTSFQEPIFAVFSRRPEDQVGPPWRLRGFERASSASFLRLFGANIPPLAWYFDEPSQLVYDTGASLNVNVEHVPHDPDRFPEALRKMSPQELAGLVNARAPEAIERVRRNYKTAIPQFYRDGRSGQSKMQLLLPVALLSRDRVELALAVDRLGPDVYLGRTVLTLDWAYNNARLLTRPDTDWLRP